ncbi:hypothetical protein D9M68_735740 [compost metagenome]
MLQNHFLLERQWHHGINIEAQTVLDFLGVADTAGELAADNRKCNASQKPQHQRQCNDQRLLRFDRLAGFDGHVEQSHVANLAFLHEAQLQRTVEH